MILRKISLKNISLILIICMFTLFVIGCSKDISDCQGKYDANNCYTKIAKSEKDVSYCQYVSMDNSDRAYCYCDVARSANDVSICDRIISESVADDQELDKYYRNYCYVEYARSKNSPNLCNHIIDDVKQKNICYSSIASDKQDSSYCDKLSTSEFQENCRESVADSMDNGIRSEKWVKYKLIRLLFYIPLGGLILWYLTKKFKLEYSSFFRAIFFVSIVRFGEFLLNGIWDARWPLWDIWPVFFLIMYVFIAIPLIKLFYRIEWKKTLLLWNSWFFSYFLLIIILNVIYGAIILGTAVFYLPK